MVIIEDMGKKFAVKLTASFLGTISILAVSVLPALAQTTPTASGSAANQATKIADLHTKCDTEINNRLTSLNTLSTRISGLKKLSADQKAKFSGQITTNVNGLTALKAKCDADTDLATLRADHKSVFTSYRIYAVFIPQLNLLAASDTMGYTADLLSDYAGKLEARIQADGNPSSLKDLLSDMKAKITDAKTQYSTVESQVEPLTPDSYNTNPTGTKSTLQTARGEIKTGAQDLKTAWSDAQQIRQGLKSESKTSVSPVPSITQ